MMLFEPNDSGSVFALCNGGHPANLNLDGRRRYSPGEHVYLRPDANVTDQRRSTLTAEVIADRGPEIDVRTDHSYWPRPGEKWLHAGETISVPRGAIFGVAIH